MPLNACGVWNTARARNTARRLYLGREVFIKRKELIKDEAILKCRGRSPFPNDIDRPSIHRAKIDEIGHRLHRSFRTNRTHHTTIRHCCARLFLFFRDPGYERFVRKVLKPMIYNAADARRFLICIFADHLQNAVLSDRVLRGDPPTIACLCERLLRCSV